MQKTEVLGYGQGKEAGFVKGLSHWALNLLPLPFDFRPNRLPNLSPHPKSLFSWFVGAPGAWVISMKSCSSLSFAIFKKAMAFSVALLLILTGYTEAWGAVGCDLNDPDRDVARLFPESTGYKTIYTSILQKGGEKLLATVETRLGDKFHGIYETIDVPYTIYEIFARKKKIGYIHGVNQKGQFGGIQVFLSLDLEGRIKAFYIQKMTSKYAGKLRDANFGRQFLGLTLKDFELYDVISGKASGKVDGIKNPAPEAEADFRAALRATKKNFILMDEFVYSTP